MSKKTPVKKSKRRLKRSVRRSLAAILMITAIGVAAIPVPENRADTGDSTGDSSVNADVHDMDGFEYEPTSWKVTVQKPMLDENGDEIKDSEGNTVMQDVSETKYDKSHDEAMTKNSKFSLNKHAGESVEDLLNAADVYTSMAITDVGNGTYDLCWQFMYYEVTEPKSNATRGVICKYNSQYAANQVNLSLNPITEYYTVDGAKYDAFYTADPAGGPAAGAVSHANGMKDMDADWDPTVEVRYSYKQYPNGLNDDVRAFFEKYAKDALTAKEAQFKAYKENLDKWLDDGGTKDDFEEQEPTALTITPSNDLNGTQKLEFYAEHDAKLRNRGTGYQLVTASDSRPGKRGTVYLAYGGTPSGDYTNENGFLVNNRADYLMCAIGDEAFKGVTNVVNMEIPSMIGYIGDEAFADAALMESIKLDNVGQIGNRAFKGCVKLATVEFAQGTEIIGAESFSGTAINKLLLPVSVNTIGYGAFSDCKSLTEIDLNNIGVACVVKDYAFYNCSNLSTVKMSGSSIRSIGEGAFSVATGAVPLGFEFPLGMSGHDSDKKDSIGDYMFAGRSGLEYVVFPQDYGSASSDAVTVPSNMFHGCVNLKYVKFPTDPQKAPQACGFASYKPNLLFADVINPDFYVQGPKTNTTGNAALPRESTWDAVTAVSKTVPYLYIENGIEYWEVSDGKYLLCINDKGVLTSCTFKPGLSEFEKKNIELEIPAVVGNTKVVSIASDCFSDDELNQEVISLKLADNSISEISDGVFRGWGKLKKVYIGNSVTKIGNDAFRDCNKLIDVTFNSPSNGHEAFTIGENAFTTGSDQLTFHGDIVKGYAPFVWAMDKDNVIDADRGIRVCYKSLSPTYLTVMYDAGTNCVTLLDYPKYSQLDNMPAKDSRYRDHNQEMEYYYYAVYGTNDYAAQRTAFALEWQAIQNGTSDKSTSDLYGSDMYGPWVTPEFCAAWGKYMDENYEFGGSSAGGDESALNSLADFFFEPVTVYAAANPTPYFSYGDNAYSVIKNYEKGSVLRPVYEQNTPEELAWISSTQNLVVPAGVESVDVNAFMKAEANLYNRTIYFTPGSDMPGEGIGQESFDMYYGETEGDEDDPTKVVPGLFSGFYDDEYTSDVENQYEQFKRGNDRLLSVTLTDVKYLPDYAFDSCERLQKVILGEACENIGTAPFRGCYSLTSVSNNKWYETYNGIVYSVDDNGSYTIEECLPSRGKTSNGIGNAWIPDESDKDLSNVTKIKDGAFQDCDYITSVALDDAAKLTVVPKDCFRDCDNLAIISLPRTINDIKTGAFVNDLKLNSLSIPGTEVFISAEAFEENPDKTTTMIYTYEDSSALRYANTYSEKYKLQGKSMEGIWAVTFLDIDGSQVGETQYVEDGLIADAPEYPERDGFVYTGWLATNGEDERQKIHENTIFIAQGHSTSVVPDGQTMVIFIDPIGNSQIATYTVDVGSSITPPAPPVHAGYTWSGTWSSQDYENVPESVDPIIISAVYTSNNTGSSTPGSSSGNSTNNGNNNNSNNQNNSSKGSTSNTSKSSTSTTSSSSGTAEKYRVTVINGAGSGSYAPGSEVIIMANNPAGGQSFVQWTTASQGVTLTDATMVVTTFTMPENSVIVTAEFTGSTPSSTPAGTTPGTTVTGTNTVTNPTGNTNNGNTRVDITKPGISNKDLATANVNGSTDNFVVKISETPEATQAVASALTNKYGSLDNILYYAMDISLYDATGSTKITNTSGLSVDITIPIPDDLVTYGGNNMAGAVVSDQLEDLSEQFTTINGVPCIRFTATHFSPYTIYVNTSNLSEGLLDATPKTGDPIHPKWFLSLGLACLSVILFMKKDKKADVKTA